MSALLARIMLVIFMLPCAAILYTITYVIAEQGRSRYGLYDYDRHYMWLAAGLTSWAFIAIYWIAIWRKSVRWTSARVTRTFVATAASIILAIISTAGMWWVDGGFALFVGASIGALAWLVSTTILWRETAEERAARVQGTDGNSLACPQCGYNLTGLKGTTCPECGKQFTLDELLAVRKEATSLERVERA